MKVVINKHSRRFRHTGKPFKYIIRLRRGRLFFEQEIDDSFNSGELLKAMESVRDFFRRNRTSCATYPRGTWDYASWISLKEE